MFRGMYIYMCIYIYIYIYIYNAVIHEDLSVPTIRAEMTTFSVMYRDKITTRPNELTTA